MKTVVTFREMKEVSERVDAFIFLLFLSKWFNYYSYSDLCTVTLIEVIYCTLYSVILTGVTWEGSSQYPAILTGVIWEGRIWIVICFIHRILFRKTNKKQKDP